MRRLDGPHQRKLPISREDILTLKDCLDSSNVGEMIIFCVILMGWYFMLRKSEYLGPGMKGTFPANYRFSIRTFDIEPHFRSQKVEWGGEVDSISLHIHGIKTDWLNCGTVRTHGMLPADHPNVRICLVRNFANLHYLIPERFSEDTSKPLQGGVTGCSSRIFRPPR